MPGDAEQPPAWRVVAAFIVAPLVPAALFSIDKPLYGDFLRSVSVVGGSHVTVMDGRTTLWGWLNYARFVALVFSFGLLGGAAFWLVAVGRRGKPRTTEA